MLTTALLLTALLAPAPAKGPLDDFLAGVRKTTLPNGLTLIHREQKGSGVVAIDTWVKAGYFDEPDEVAGMAHLFEHMFFKGSKRFPGAEQIAQELSAVGGVSNAGTIYDSTNYYFVVPAEGFARAMEIQADAILDPLFEPGELAKEAEVVIEESNRKQDNPAPLAWERMVATSFTQHRIRRWRIGSNEVLRNIRRPDLLAFFQTLYRPENMILAVTGDVTFEQAQAAARGTFGRIPRGKVDRKRGPAEPAQSAFRFGRSEGDIRQGRSVLGWHTQGVHGEDSLALDLAAAILGQGRSSRLYRAAVGPDGAGTIEASHSQYADVGVFSIDASFDEKNRAAVEGKALQEVARLAAHGPTEFELQLAKNQAESALAVGLESALGQATTLAYAEANHGHAALGSRLRATQALSAGQVQDVVRRYLTADRLTLYHYQPRGAAAADEKQALLAVQAALASAPPALAATPAPPPARPGRAARPGQKPAEVRLANGATLIVEERPGAPSLSVGVYFRGGRSEEDGRNAGITSLMLDALQRGTRTRSGEQLDREIEYLGTEVGSTVQPDFFGLTMTLLSRNAGPGLDLLADLLANPTFPADGVEKERASQLAVIARALDDSSRRPFELALRALWGSHPYALPAQGTADSVAALGPEALREWWTRAVGLDRATFVVVGDLHQDDAKDRIEAAFGKLPARAAVPLVEPGPPAAPPARTELVEFRDRRQSAIVLAFPGIAAGHPDGAALDLLRRITSGLSGTLFAELRGKRSLAYTVFSGSSSLRRGGFVFGYLASDASKEQDARQGLLGELRRTMADGLSPEGLARGKKLATGATRIGLQTNAARRGDLAGNHLLGLGLDATDRQLERIQQISLEELRAVCTRYFSTDAHVTAVVRGKAS